MQGNWENPAFPKENELLQVVTFMLNVEVFAFDLSHVKEIIRLGDITRVPRAPEYITGVFNLRGNIIPILNLKKKLGWAAGEYTARTRIIVVEVHGIMLGLIVDSVLETRKIPVSVIELPPTIVMFGLESDYIPGIAKLDDRLVILLDIFKILAKSGGGQ